MPENEKFVLKDALFNPQKVQKLADEITAVYPAFNRQAFENTLISQFPSLELKQRLSAIRTALKMHLPDAFPSALAIILRALPAPCDPNKTDDDFGDFIYAPYAEFVATYGCTQEHLSLSLDALEYMTQRFSAEDAIRYFINAFPDETFEKLKTWATHPHYHVRRLVSEGTRPRLPWCLKITYDLDRFLPLLDTLSKDKTRYVTRSVANHLNDISKFNPDAVVATLKKWQKAHIEKTDFSFIRQHSLRTLIKTGHPDTLLFLGFNPTSQANISLSITQPSIKIGDALAFTIHIHPTIEENIVLDYVLHFQSKSGKPSEKVFKLKTLKLTPGKPISIEKNHVFKDGMTTRTFYPGEHGIQLQVNGKRLPIVTFDLHKI